MIENVGAELKKYFESKSIFSSLLGFGSMIIYGSIALTFINLFLGWGFISGLITYLFLLGVVLALANLDFTSLMIGFGANALLVLIGLIIILANGLFSWALLFTVAIYGYFTYAAYMKTLKKA